MREILFKAKNCAGKWAQGLLAHKDNKWYISNIAGMPFAYEVRPENICQYTGLTDKNGNKIWENDIVKVEEHAPYVNGLYKVIYCETSCNYALIRNNFTHGYFSFSDLNGFETTSEVIGNIFDNPELLEGSGEE